jgi:hypothetical protein
MDWLEKINQDFKMLMKMGISTMIMTMTLTIENDNSKENKHLLWSRLILLE